MTIKRNLLIEQKTLLEITATLEERLLEELKRFKATGSRTIAAKTWRDGTLITLHGYYKELAAVSKALRELEEPEELVQELVKGMGLLTLVRLWWKA